MKTALFVALGVFTSGYLGLWGAAIGRGLGAATGVGKKLLDAAVGFVTNFFDTLGIGSFATTTSIFKLLGLVRDEQIPGTLNVGHTLPTVVQAFIYIQVVEVDITTLIVMIGASVVGSWLGAGVVSKFSRRAVQIGMGVALLVMAGFMLAKLLSPTPEVGTLGLTGSKLVIAAVANALLGALMTLGIGMYAPCMVLIYLLGMNTKTAFPIMMGSCAFLMPVGSARFIREGSYNLTAALGLAIGGIPAVLLAAFIVKSMDLRTVQWLVIGVVVYTSAMMLRSAFVERGNLALKPSVQEA